MIRTIENDPTSPFGEREVPAAEWTYRAWLKDAGSKGGDFVAAHVMLAGQRSGREFRYVPTFPQGCSLERTVQAYVNHGRWLWDCPVCNASQVASEIDARAFCVECFNGGDGWYPVEWPNDRVAIETLLDRRERDNQRHWYPHETLEQLQAENLSIGVDPELAALPWPGAQDALALVREHRALTVGDDEVRALLAPNE